MARPLGSALLCALCGVAIGADADTRHAAAVAKLADQFATGTPYQRSNAADALQHDGAADAAAADTVLATTISAIDGSQWPVARLGVDTLAAIKPDALSRCTTALQRGIDHGGEARRECVQLAIGFGAAGAPLAPRLAALVADPDSRRDALRALASMGSGCDAAVTAIVAAARDRDAAAARAGIEALARLGPTAKPTIPTLCELLTRDDVREAVLDAIGSFGRGGASAMPQVLEAARRHGQGPQAAAFVRALQQIEPADIPPVGAPAAVSCQEGDEVVIALAATDVDDLPSELRGELVGTPLHGTVVVRDALHLAYHAGWGFVGDESLTWRPGDGRAQGEPVPLVISITPQPEPPKAVRFTMLPDQHERLRVAFDKPPEKSSAGTATNYGLSQGIRVLGATLLEDQRTVELRTSGIEPGKAYELSVHKVASRALAPKTLDADHIAFTARTVAPGLRGEWFDNKDLSGTAEAVRIDPVLDFPKGPKPGRENYSVRWTGQIEVPTTGTYTFFLTCDDGGRLWVDGKQLVDAWDIHGSTEYSGAIDLQAGKPCDIRIEYFQCLGDETLTLGWSGPGIGKGVVPTTVLSTAP
jgi:hypothetical protein